MRCYRLNKLVTENNNNHNDDDEHSESLYSPRITRARWFDRLWQVNGRLLDLNDVPLTIYILMKDRVVVIVANRSIHFSAWCFGVQYYIVPANYLILHWSTLDNKTSQPPGHLPWPLIFVYSQFIGHRNSIYVWHTNKLLRILLTVYQCRTQSDSYREVYATHTHTLSSLSR